MDSKQHVKENLESNRGKEIYAQRKTDVETNFGRMRGVLDMRSAHVRGKQAVHNDTYEHESYKNSP
ncbi:transposase [Jeotgalibaca sp. A127]|uniref:transposase n=1 Tax=Jeotgalibaca sp. A127 TaxID=3457324 RepID=UPI003FD0167E